MASYFVWPAGSLVHLCPSLVKIFMFPVKDYASTFYSLHVSLFVISVFYCDIYYAKIRDKEEILTPRGRKLK